MRGLGILCFVLLLPVLAVLGHDAYATYKDEDFTKTLMLSDVGFLWTTYEPATYEWTRKNVSADTWEDIISPILEQTSLLVAAVPAAIACSVWLLLSLLRLLGLPPFHAGAMTNRSKEKQRGYSYKRK